MTALLSTRASNGAAKQEPAFQEKGKIFAHGIVIKLSMTPGKSVWIESQTEQILIAQHWKGWPWEKWSD